MTAREARSRRDGDRELRHGARPVDQRLDCRVEHGESDSRGGDVSGQAPQPAQQEPEDARESRMTAARAPPSAASIVRISTVPASGATSALTRSTAAMSMARSGAQATITRTRTSPKPSAATIPATTPTALLSSEGSGVRLGDARPCLSTAYQCAAQATCRDDGPDDDDRVRRRAGDGAGSVIASGGPVRSASFDE